MQPFAAHSSLRRRADHIGREFLAEVLGYASRRRPDDLAVLSDLGQVLTALGRYEQGLAIDRRLTRLLPEDPTVHYNLACSLSLSGRPNEALDALEHAVELGYDDPRHLLADSDLEALHDEPRFREVAARLGEAGAR